MSVESNNDERHSSFRYKMIAPTSHVDTFAQDHLPPATEWPQFNFSSPHIMYPDRLNAACKLLDDAIAEGHGSRTAILESGSSWTYSDLLRASDEVAHVLVHEEGLVPGNRVLLMASNSRMLAASWLAVLRAGGIAVTAMPLLRAHELGQIAIKARIDHALCDSKALPEVRQSATQTGFLGRIRAWGNGDLEKSMTSYTQSFRPIDTAIDDVAIIAFTSGTTGTPKATMHFHRDILAMADIVGRSLLHTSLDDVYVGSPPLGFTFGLGALLVFPLRFRAAAAYVSRPTADSLLGAIEQHRATALFTSPTMYRTLIDVLPRFNTTSLRRCISAGEPLSRATSDSWHKATGIRLTDGIGSTEMIHIFIGADGAEAKPGATGKPLPGYEAVVLDIHGKPQTIGSGRLAVRGPTGCRYLDDPRQKDYVKDGWNVTGDLYRIDQDGYFWFESRSDDMIISSGYNIASPEVESALQSHEAVLECAVIGAPDPVRGQIVKAYVVLRSGWSPSELLVTRLQNFVKAQIAPYKYPRAIEFVDSLPKTPTGKIQRHILRTIA